MKVLQVISFDEVDQVKDTFVTYRIRSDKVDPKNITFNLGIQPTKSYTVGDKYLGKAIDPETKNTIKVWRKQPFNLWDLSSEGLYPSKKRVEEHIVSLLNIIEPHQEQIFKLLSQKEEYIVSFYIRWEPIVSHGSYQIPGELLQRIGVLCHFVEYSFIYSSEGQLEK